MIEISNLTKLFDKKRALDAVTTTIEKGCIYGLVGSNGSGKSTLLRTLAGIYKPNEGTIMVDGNEVFENPATKARIFYISDDQYTERTSCIAEMARRYRLVYPDYDEAYAIELAKRFKLDPKAKFRTFSKGMTRQSHIILGLAAKPDILICDETFDGLDPVKRQAVKALLAEAVLDRGATIIIASHNLRELEDICDVIGLLHEGHLVAQRSLEDMQSGIYKLQIAFDFVRREEDFAALAPRSFESRGRMISMIVRGDADAIAERAAAMSPLYYEVLPLTLEEVFISEMEVLGYDSKELGV